MLNQTLKFLRSSVSGCALAVALFAGTARAVIIDGSNGNLSPPTPAALAGFNGAGSFNDFYNVGMSSTGGASFVYLGNGWCLTAQHVTIANALGHLSFNPAFSTQPLTVTGDATTIITPNVDLRLFHIDQTPGGGLVPALPSLPISGAAPAAGSQVMMIGNGISLSGGAGAVGTTYWNNFTFTGPSSANTGVGTGTAPVGPISPLPPLFPGPVAGVNNVDYPATYPGYPGTYQAAGYPLNAASQSIRWGMNLVEGTGLTIGYSTIVGGITEPAFYTAFNDPTGRYTPGSLGVNDEAQASPGDSGGGVFSYNAATSQWELSGIMVVADGYANNQFGFYGDTTFIVDLSQYRSQIDAITGVPEPSTLALAALGVAALCVGAGPGGRRWRLVK